MKRVVIILIVFFSVISYSQNSDGEATIYITRSGYVGSAGAIGYFLNDTYIGKLNNSEHFKIKCEPKRQKIWIAGSKKKVLVGYVLHPEKGRVYYLNTNLGKAKGALALINNDSKALKKARQKIEKKTAVEPLTTVKPNFKEKYAGLTQKVATTEYPEGVFSDYKSMKPKKKSSTTLASIYNIGGLSSSSSVVASSTPVTTDATKQVALLTAGVPTSTSNVSTTASAVDYSIMTLEELEEEKKTAIIKEDYTLASVIKDHITAKKVPVSDLEKQKQEAVANEDYDKAAKLKLEIQKRKALKISKELPDSGTSLASISATRASSSGVHNKRETALSDLLSKRVEDHSVSTSANVITTNTFSKTKRGVKKDTSDSTNAAVYRRSSLYTLMIDNPVREHANTIKNTFGDTDIPEKFNDHNVGPYLISTSDDAKDKTYIINDFLSTNDIAKQLVSKWFNRSEKGGFNMDLISERGSYNATDLDVSIAQNNERGLALLADAGEELIKNTFVVVNDYKYTDKEVVAKKAGKWLNVVSSVASAAGLDVVSTVASATNLATSVAGKGYVIKSTTYLYKLVWNEEVASIFYNEYWTTDGVLDVSKKEAFDNSNMFQLELVGTESAIADLQSSAFTKKSDTDLISTATVKSTNKAIAKLQRKYEVFRTKTPLLSGDPITAKIGLKEGLEKGDKFEVLEQVLTKEGKTEYKRVGVVKVDKSHIWDNRYKAADEQENTDEIEPYTIFKGGKNFYSGMLIRQIN